MAEEQRYRPHLDSLRGLAIITVLYTHYWVPDTIIGPCGVRLFFVLSGFLITRNLLRLRYAGPQNTPASKRASRRLFTFFARRLLRLWPAYYLLLGSALLLNIGHIRDVAYWHLFFTSNILFSLRHAYLPWPTAPWWTVDVEEQFYILWPFFILLPPGGLIPWLPIAAIGTGVLYHAVMMLLGHDSFANWYLLPASLDALGAGALLAVVQWKYSRFPAWLPWAALASLIIMRLLEICGVYWLNYSLVTIPAAALVAAGDDGFRGIPGWFMSLKPIQELGRRSYGVYLYHMFVMGIIEHFCWRIPALSKTGPIMFITASAGSIAVASLSWSFIELPANRLKRYFPYTLSAQKPESTQGLAPEEAVLL